MALSEEDVIQALRDCYDPELPVNIVDLGLIYKVMLTPDANSKRAFLRPSKDVALLERPDENSFALENKAMRRAHRPNSPTAPV